MKRVITLFASLLITFYTFSCYAGDRPPDDSSGVFIEDKSVFPLSKYSQLVQHDGSPSLRLTGSESDNYSVIVSLLSNMEIPYQVVSESPAIFQTDWISWHYDEESKKAMSHYVSRFYDTSRRDKYKFKISIKNIQQQSHLLLDKVDRQQEVDITPDTEIIWLKWQEQPPDKHAIKAFLQRLRTEYEVLMMAANAPVPVVAPVAPVISTNKAVSPGSNYMALDMSVDQAWGVVIKQVAQKSVPMANTRNRQHMLNTEWVYAEYNAETSSLDTSKTESQRHKFQVMVIPGARSDKSTLFVYHTDFQRNSGNNTWSDEDTQEAIAAAFLDFLDIE